MGELEAAGGREGERHKGVPGFVDSRWQGGDRPDRRHQTRFSELRPGEGGRHRGGNADCFFTYRLPLQIDRFHSLLQSSAFCIAF